MCLTIPGKIISTKNEFAKVDFNGEMSDVNCKLVNAKKGDYVLSQNGMAIKKVDKKDALYVLKLLNR